MHDIDKKIILASVITLSVFIFYLSFTSFDVRLAQKDVVSDDAVIVSTDETAITNFIASLESEKQQALGIGVFVDFLDSNNQIIPQESKFLSIPFTDTSISLLGKSGELLDFAKIRFDVNGIVLHDDNVQLSAEYEILSNGTPFVSGLVFGDGMTTDKRLDLDFENSGKRGNVFELSFEKNEIPFKQDFTNTLEFRIKKVEAVVGSEFDTKQYNWSGDFPVYTLKYDADSKSKTVRDFMGIATRVLE